MSTHLEDRLTAALNARANLVQPEDLRSSPVRPTDVRPLRRGRALAWVAVAASVAIAATAAVVLRADDDRPDPADEPLPGGYAEIGRASGDIDGDGRADLLRLARPEPVTRVPSAALLVVDLATARRLTRELDAGPLPSLVGLAEVGADGRAIVTRTPDGGKDFTLAVHLLDQGRLVRVRESKDSDERLQQRGSDVRLGYATEPRLTVWRFVGPAPQEVEEVRVVSWSLEDGQLVGRYGDLRCVQHGDPVARACPDITSVPEGMVEGPSIAVDLDADGVEDDIQMSGPKPLGSAPTVIIATLSSGDRTGTTMQHYGTFGGFRSVRLQSDHGPVTAVVVQSALSGGMPRSVYRLVDGRLTELLLATDVPVAPGRLDVSGYRVWSRAVDGTLLSWRQVTRGGRAGVQEVVTYRYRTEGYRLIPVKVGRQCYDGSETTSVPYPC